MGKQYLIELRLPEFAFVDGSEHEKKDILKDRTVILHVRSASVIEIIERENAFITEGTLTYNFTHTDLFGIEEDMIALLHYCTTLDKDADRGMIINHVLKPAAQWYCNYCDWEDRNIINNR